MSKYIFVVHSKFWLKGWRVAHSESERIREWDATQQQEQQEEEQEEQNQEEEEQEDQDEEEDEEEEQQEEEQEEAEEEQEKIYGLGILYRLQQHFIDQLQHQSQLQTNRTPFSFQTNSLQLKMEIDQVSVPTIEVTSVKNTYSKSKHQFWYSC